jgi:hypothetical protein
MFSNQNENLSKTHSFKSQNLSRKNKAIDLTTEIEALIVLYTLPDVKNNAPHLIESVKIADEEN